ncbi:MAG: hypothetical protein OHK0022_51350 [Roseiflexaceae bacterium]
MKRNQVSALLSAGALLVVLVAVVALIASQPSRAGEGTLVKFPDFPPTPTAGQAPPDTQAVGGARLFSEAFASAASLSAWSVIDPQNLLPEDASNWLVEEGQLIQDRAGFAKSPSERETMLVAGTTSWTDYVVSAKVYDSQNATFGLVARRQGDSFYRYRVIADLYEATPKHVLEKVVNGVATPLATLDGPGYAKRKWHSVSLSVVGSKIEARLNGALVLQATDSTLTSGQAGLYTRAFGGIRFDDVAVAQPK